MGELSGERASKLYADGSVDRASKWLSEQYDPFEIISDMRKSGNLALLLAHYREPDS